jgi:hypothetical protein
VRDWIAALDAASGKVLWRKYTVPAPGEPGSETWKGTNNAWQPGGAAVWVTETYDPDTNQTIWGTGNPVPMFDPNYRPGYNLYTNSAISWDPENGKMHWYFQYTPGDMWDYDEVGTRGPSHGCKNGRSLRFARFLETLQIAKAAILSPPPTCGARAATGPTIRSKSAFPPALPWIGTCVATSSFSRLMLRNKATALAFTAASLPPAGGGP